MNVIERRARMLVSERAGGLGRELCESCGQARAVDWAHRLARSHGGAWCPSNGLAVCRGCHEWQRRCVADARAAGHVLITGQDPSTEPCWTATHGWVLLRPDGALVSLGADRRGVGA